MDKCPGPNGFTSRFYAACWPVIKAANSVALGDGRDTTFWLDPWLDGECPKDLAPALVLGNVASFSVAAGCLGNSWTASINPNLSEEGIRQFLLLWDRIANVELGSGVDSFRWNWITTGQFSAKSAYLAFFEGRVEFAGLDLVWSSKAPSRCKFFL
ncbi:hypothetical protein BRADI_2g06275v3 [Brachypodium distachyon]|uniref:Uncharacterized protein n=1 Tax=Brachypodium distachyon TaxID=15368 RepID=A0A2K2D778_BRADI|nr:hypothetical protein BRADI_2g06275v3 [Brachypodium distachyon]